MRKWTIVVLAIAAALLIAFLAWRASTKEPLTEGIFSADGTCPTFRPRYAQTEIVFGNRGLSTLNSIYETFVGEGAFEISEFRVVAGGPGRYRISADSNRGELVSDIFADRIVRQGQDRENEQVRRTLQSAYCHRGRIFEHQLVDMGDGSTLSQDLEYWTEDGALVFRLYQNRRLTAEVRAR